MATNPNNERVLVLAPIGRDGPVTAELLRESGLAAEVCADAGDAARQLADGAGALLLTEEVLERAGVDELFRQLRAQPPWSELPLIILTHGGEARLPRLLDLAAQAAGAITLLERPLGSATLLRTIEVALRSRRRQYQVRDLLDQELRQNAALDAARSLALERLREIEDIYRNAPVGLCVLDRELRYVRINARLAAINGIPVAEHIGKTVRDVLPQLADTVTSDMLRVLETGEPRLDIEVLGETPARPGVRRSWLEQWIPIVDDKGRVSGLSVVAEETTERRDAESALRESEQRLALAASGTRIGIYDWSVASGEVAATEQVARLIGLRTTTTTTTTTTLSQRYQYREWAEHVHPEDLARVEAELRRCMRKRAPLEVEYRVIRSEGDERWLTTRGVFEHDDTGSATRLLGILMDITAAKESEAQIVRAKQEWERTFDSVSDLIFVTDEKHRMVRVNRAMAERLGRPVKECVGQPCYAHVHGTKAPPKACMHASALSSVITQTAEWHSKCLDGDFLVSASPLRDAGGRVGLVHVMRDITEQKRAEARNREAMALAAASQTAVDAFEAMGEGVLVLDMKGRILSANPALERMTGIRKRAVVGSAVGDIFSRILSAQDTATAEDALAKALKGQRADLHPLALSGKSRRRLTVIPSVSFVRGPKGAAKAVVVTLRDISKLMAVQAALVESEQKYRELVENANSIIMRITPEHDITFFNDYAQTFFGYTADEILGRNVVGTIMPPVDSEGRDLRQMIREITAHPEEHGSNDNENIRKDGRRVWVHWSNRAIRDEQGHVKEILCVGTDVTERKRLEREAEVYRKHLRTLAERLTATEEQDRRRIATHIHDTVVQTLSLSNIRLGGVMAAVEKAGLSKQQETVAGVRRLLDQGTKECRGLMEALVPSLLYEAGLLAALREFAQKQARTVGATIHIDEDDSLEPIDDALRGLLFQCARELIMNAEKYAGPCEIRVSVSSADHHLQLRVQDNGRGFDPVELDGAKRDPAEGGFGLFNIRERVESSDGRLEIESAPGKGTAVTVWVPVGG